MTGPDEHATRLTWRFRLLACSLVLAAVSFTQRPGQLVSDTKLDLVVDPGGFLARALHFWEPLAGFGQVQNQAYGYLFPLGSFFWVGDLLTIPPWVVQRLWWTVLLVTAFLGVVKLCGVLGLGNPTGRLLAGFAYALSPRILTTLGPISIEAWPSAVAPWVLVPLVIGSTRGSPRRAAALSALAVAAVGGVNAAATFAVIPLGVIWLLTRRPGPRRRALMLWWPLFVLVGTAWWLVPLFLLGRYSPPFLDYIETASVTTFPATLFDALRGTSHWVPYVDGSWQAGNDLLTTGYIALNAVVLVVLGVVGIASRANPHRVFLVAGLVTGLLVVTAGHTGAVHGWAAPAVQDLLDGALAPLRNVHKLDPLIRLPMVLGLAHAVRVLAERSAAAREEAPARGHGWAVRSDAVVYRAVVLVVAVALVGMASPAFSGRLAPAQAFPEVPGYWTEAARWLDEHAEEDTSLLVPGSSFATYQWGDPEDEPLQPLASSSWAVRNAVPLAPPGNIRMLDAVEARLSAGRPSAGLAAYLRRAGIGRVVLRNDLRGSADQPEPALVRRALEGSPGIERVAAFGPWTGGLAVEELDDTRVVSGDGWTTRGRAVEVYRVDGAARAAMTATPPVVVGGPESLLELADVGALGDEPTVLAVDAAERPEGSPVILTDGLRRREVSFARLREGRSPTLEAGDDGRLGAPAREYSLQGGERWETRARTLGVERLDASSSAAFADADGPSRPDALPFAAVDGRAETGWVPDTSDAAPWLEAVFSEPRAVGSVDVVLAPGPRRDPVRLRLETDRGSGAWARGRPGETVTLSAPAGPLARLRLALADESGEDPVEVAEVRVPDLRVERTLVLPRVPAPWGAPETILLSAAEGRRSACLEVAGDVRCGQGRERYGEERLGIDRTVRLGAGADYRIAVTAEPVYSDALRGLIQRDRLVDVRTSSLAVREARASGLAAIDGDRGTTWTADPEDERPTLTLNWIGQRTVREISLLLDEQAPAAAVTRARLRYAGGAQTVRLDDSGRAEVRPFRSDWLAIEVLDDDGSLRRLADGSTEPLPPGVSEVRAEGLGLLPVRPSEVPTDIGCGFGPTLRVGGQVYATSVVASARDLYEGRALPARVCGPAEVGVGAGATRVVLADAPAFRGSRVEMQRGEAGPQPATVARTASPSPVERTIERGDFTGAGYLALRENVNPGWSASTDGERALEPVTIDGWQQGWVLPAGEGAVHARFAADRYYRAALLLGGVLLAGLALGVVVARRRPPAREWPPLRARRPSRWAWVVGGGGALVLLGGWWGLAAAALLAVLVLVGDRIGPAVPAWAVGLPVGAAALVYWARPLGSASGWAGAGAAPHVLVLLTLVLMLAVPPAREDDAAAP